jgi:glyoxylase-like metal-dependent hydrolase (beta-lactamase superfamily II)
VAQGVHIADVEHLGNPGYIAASVLECDDGLVIIDPGPTTSLPGLARRLDELGASFDDVASLLLTHIHLDHAGASGVLVREHPRIRVHVHERGAKHVLDPGSLLDSATRLYGADMERLWGEVAAVPAANVVSLTGGETLAPGGRTIRVAYTPGHAWHHVSYLEEAAGLAFVGDTCGERFLDARYVLPVTPPPDIDLEAWAASSACLREWDADALVVTHFGLCTRPSWHLDTHDAELADWAERVRKSLDQPGTDDEHAARFRDDVFARIAETLPPENARPYDEGAPDASWSGLARYWRKRLSARPS